MRRTAQVMCPLAHFICPLTCGGRRRAVGGVGRSYAPVALAGHLGAVGAAHGVVGGVLDTGDELRRRCVPATA